MIIIYGTATKYAAPINTDIAGGPNVDGFVYAAFQDTHVMMLIGFGFLYTLLRRYAWSGVGWNFISECGAAVTPCRQEELHRRV